MSRNDGHIPALTSVSVLVFWTLFLLDRCSGTSPAEASLEARMVQASGSAGRKTSHDHKRDNQNIAVFFPFIILCDM